MTKIFMELLSRLTTKKTGFTLAEALITIGIIGIVAAVTIPTLISNWEARSYKSASTAFERKFGEALRLMNVQGDLQGYSNTKDFVSALQKYMKISKVCNKPEDCFAKEIIHSDNSVIPASTLTTAETLGRASFRTNAVGLIFADGINAILAYNPGISPDANGEIVTFSSDDSGEIRTIKLSTNAITMIYDVNGAAKPNTRGKDILGINNSIGGGATKCDYEQHGDFCVNVIPSMAVTCSKSDNGFYQYCGSRSNYASDYWAGAQVACAQSGMRLPNSSELSQISFAMKADGVTLSGNFWSTNEDNAQYGIIVNLGTGSSGRILKNDYSVKVLCTNN